MELFGGSRGDKTDTRRTFFLGDRGVDEIRLYCIT